MTAIPLNTMAVTSPMPANTRKIQKRMRDSLFMIEDYVFLESSRVLWGVPHDTI
jgi:hypothetical protein